MSEAPPSPESPAERAEKAATRRRWVTLAEAVAVAGVLIAGATLWLNWSERRDAEASRVSEQASEGRSKAAARAVRLTASIVDGGTALRLADATHDVQSIELRFPTKLGVDQQSSEVQPVIEARWIAAAVLAATDGGADERDGRLPVAITARYWDGERQVASSAIYDLVWRTEGRTLQGRALRLRGLIPRERVAVDAQARLDALFKGF